MEIVGVFGDLGSTFGASHSSFYVNGIGSCDFLDLKSSSNFTSFLTNVFLCFGI
jgi:hypothetical protein